MTYPEIIRMFCYMVSAPAFLILALDEFRQHRILQSIRDLSFSMLFLWYMMEITLISIGVNTREYRVIGTPMIVAVSFAAALLAGRVLMNYYRLLKK